MVPVAVGLSTGGLANQLSNVRNLDSATKFRAFLALSNLALNEARRPEHGVINADGIDNLLPEPKSKGFRLF